MTIAKHLFTGILVAIASGYIKLLERIYRRWQLKSCSNLLTRVTTLSTCTTGVDTGVESESPPRSFISLPHPSRYYAFNIMVQSSVLVTNNALFIDVPLAFFDRGTLIMCLFSLCQRNLAFNQMPLPIQFGTNARMTLLLCRGKKLGKFLLM